MLIWVQSKFPLDVRDLVLAEGGTVRLGVAGEFALDANHGTYVDKGRFLFAGASTHEGSSDPFYIITAIFNIDHIPATCSHLGVDVLGVADVHTAITRHLGFGILSGSVRPYWEIRSQRYLVVIVDDDQIVESPVASELD